MSIYTPCRNGHSVRHRFTTKQGYVRCALCLQAARDKHNAKLRARWPKSLATTFLAVATALEAVPLEFRGNILRAAAVVHGVRL